MTAHGSSEDGEQFRKEAPCIFTYHKSSVLFVAWDSTCLAGWEPRTAVCRYSPKLALHGIVTTRQGSLVVILVLAGSGTLDQRWTKAGLPLGTRCSVTASQADFTMVSSRC